MADRASVADSAGFAGSSGYEKGDCGKSSRPILGVVLLETSAGPRTCGDVACAGRTPTQFVMSGHHSIVCMTCLCQVAEIQAVQLLWLFRGDVVQAECFNGTRRRSVWLAPWLWKPVAAGSDPAA